MLPALPCPCRCSHMLTDASYGRAALHPICDISNAPKVLLYVKSSLPPPHAPPCAAVLLVARPRLLPIYHLHSHAPKWPPCSPMLLAVKPSLATLSPTHVLSLIPIPSSLYDIRALMLPQSHPRSLWMAWTVQCSLLSFVLCSETIFRLGPKHIPNCFCFRFNDCLAYRLLCPLLAFLSFYSPFPLLFFLLHFLSIFLQSHSLPIIAHNSPFASGIQFSLLQSSMTIFLFPYHMSIYPSLVPIVDSHSSSSAVISIHSSSSQVNTDPLVIHPYSSIHSFITVLYLSGPPPIRLCCFVFVMISPPDDRRKSLR